MRRTNPNPEAPILKSAGRLESVLAMLSPGWSARRSRARLMSEIDRQRLVALSTYEAAEKSRHTADWSAKNRTADQAITADYWTILARARAAARDDWSGASIGDGWVRHVIGTGITCWADARDPISGDAWEGFNTALDDWWEYWSERPTFCDMEGRKTLTDTLALCEREVVNAGQAFVIMNYFPTPGVVGLRLQMFEPEQLDQSVTSFTDKDTRETREIKNGIEVDEYGRAVAYHVYQRKHPYESYGGESERISGHRVLHLMRQDRVRQTHGITRMAPSLREMWHQKMYAEYVLLRARFEACGGASVKREAEANGLPVAGLDTGDASDDRDANDNLQLNFEPNMVWDPGPGVEIQFHDPKTPGGQYEPFTKQGAQKIAAGSGLDYPTVSRDFAGNSFAGQRQGMLETEKETDPEQGRVISAVLRPIREMFTDLAIMEQRVLAPLYYQGPAYRRAYHRTIYQPQAKKWIDPANQAAAAKIILETDQDTYKHTQAERGLHWRRTFVQKAKEEQTRRELGLGVEPGARPPTSPNEPRPEADHATPNPVPTLSQIRAGRFNGGNGS